MLKGTTILAVKKDGNTVIIGDGQVTLGEKTVMKHTAKKVRRICNEKVVVGFAGTVADAFALCDKFELKIEQYSGSLLRAAVELAQEWRSDKALRKLEAMLIVADKENLLLVSGTGEVIESDDGVLSIGSGSNYALSAARALVRNTDMSAKDIAMESMKVASEICVYTNDHFTVEEV